jgi:AmiR/NasT family two-component response regulator
MKLKNIIKESAYLGELPSSKLKKMKWNPVTDKKAPVNELNSRMAGLVDMSDKRKLADVIEAYVYAFAEDGFDERDIQKYMAEIVQSYVRSNYRKASR